MDLLITCIRLNVTSHTLRPVQFVVSQISEQPLDIQGQSDSQVGVKLLNPAGLIKELDETLKHTHPDEELR